MYRHTSEEFKKKIINIDCKDNFMSHYADATSFILDYFASVSGLRNKLGLVVKRAEMKLFIIENRK